jgi:hypothetical protein
MMSIGIQNTFVCSKYNHNRFVDEDINHVSSYIAHLMPHHTSSYAPYACNYHSLERERDSSLQMDIAFA